MHVYVYNPNTGTYGHLRGVNIYQSGGLFAYPDEYLDPSWRKVYEGEMVCEDTNIPYTVKCTTSFVFENTDTEERKSVNITNYFVIPVYL